MQVKTLPQWNDNIVLAMQSNDNNAFAQCYQVLSPAIYSAVLKISGDKNIANDLLHDTFIDAFENINSFNPVNNFPAWIKRIAFNNTFNYLKKSENKLHIVSDVEQEISSDPLPEQQLVNVDLLNRLLALVSKNDRFILWLYIVEQYKHEEISLLVNKSPSYSKSIVARSLKKIQEHIEVKQYAYKF